MAGLLEACMQGFRVTAREGRVLVTHEGELSPMTPQDLREVEEAVFARQDATGILLDLSGTSFMNSLGIGLLIRLKKGAAERRLPLCLLTPSPQVCKVLTMVNLIRHFEVCETDGPVVAEGEVPFE